MIWTNLTKLAYAVALGAHAGQCDKAGHPYIEHPLYVASQMTDEKSTAVALLHDVFEDTAVTPEQLLAEPLCFPPDIIRSVQTLTHTKDDGRTYLEYVRDIRSDPIAVQVKLADLSHNSQLDRLGRAPTEKDLERVKRYEKARAILIADD